MIGRAMIRRVRAGLVVAAGAACLAACGGGNDPGAAGRTAPEPAEPPGAGRPDAAEPEDWVVLLDGSGLAGWELVGGANWRVADGTVRADAGEEGHLVSAESYDDFELHVELWVSDDANSGIFLRCADRVEVDPETCYEVNVFDRRPDPTYRTGSIVGIAPPTARVDAGGRWNTFEITARGPRLMVVLNGTTTVDIEDRAHSEGPITLQYGAGTVMFRSVRLRPL